MGFFFKRAKLVLLWTAIVFGSMLFAGWAVKALYPDDWRPVEAVARSTHLKLVNVSRGNDAWALMVEAAYEVAGRPFEATAAVFRDRERSVTEAEVEKWPAGRTFTLYFDADNPESVSLYPDGGREAVIVAAVLLTPLVVGLVALIVFLVRRMRANALAPR